MLQDVQNVFVHDTCLAFYVSNRYFFPVYIREEHFDDSPGPKVQVRAVTEIGKRSFGAAWLLLYDRQAIGHLDQDFSVAIPLSKGHDHDARQIIGFRVGISELLLREIPHEVPPVFSDLAEDVKQERLDGILQILVVQEHSADIRQVLAIRLLLAAVDLKKRDAVPILDVAVSVDFVTGRASLGAHHRMSADLLSIHEEREAEIANVEALGVVLCRQWGEVPGLDPVAAELYGLDSFELGDLEKVINFLLGPVAVQRIFVLLYLFLLTFDLVLLFLFLLIVHLEEMLSGPSVRAPIDPQKVDVVLVPQGLFDFLLVL